MVNSQEQEEKSKEVSGGKRSTFGRYLWNREWSMPDSPCHSLLCHGFPGPGGLHPHGDCLPDKTGDTPSIQTCRSGDLLSRRFILVVLILLLVCM